LNFYVCFNPKIRIYKKKRYEMETKTEKMEWSKPVLEELGIARYALGTCSTGNNGTHLDCNPGSTPQGNPNTCSPGVGTAICMTGSGTTTLCAPGTGR
jgi:hypothetical protein